MNNITKGAAVFLVSAGMALSGCSVFRGQSTPGEYVDDVAITSKVKASLLDDDRVEGLDVNVDSTNGKVRLTGWADSEAEKRRVADLARKVDGVKSVDNQIQVKR
jgi:hyperosmotically inducible protein